MLICNSGHLIDEISRFRDVYGFDLEWEPSRMRGKENKTALVQVCDADTILLVHVSRMKRECFGRNATAACSKMRFAQGFRRVSKHGSRIRSASN